MANADFYIKEGDRDPALIVTCVDENRDVIDLSAATQVQFNMINPGTTTPEISLAAAVFEGPQSGGKVKYLWTTGDTDTPGKYNGEFVITWSGGNKTRFPNYKYILIEIMKKIA